MICLLDSIFASAGKFFACTSDTFCKHQDSFRFKLFCFCNYISVFQRSSKPCQECKQKSLLKWVKMENSRKPQLDQNNCHQPFTVLTSNGRQPIKLAPPLHGINHVRRWAALAYAGLIFYPKVKKSIPQIVETCTIFIHKTVDIGCVRLSVHEIQ